MFAPPSFIDRTKLAAVIVAQLSSSQAISAASLSLGVLETERTRMSSAFLTDSPFPIKGGFRYELGAGVVYDSNLRLEEDGGDTELTTFLAPSISYFTDPEGGARYSIEADYSPVVRHHMEESSLNGIDQNGRAAIRFNGNKTKLVVSAGYNEVASSDRLTGKFSEGSIVRFDIYGAYQIAPRTSVTASWTSSESDYEEDADKGSTVHTLETGAFWEATERSRLGPSVRWREIESGNTGRREALAVLGRAEHLLGERLRFAGSAGVEFSEDSRSDGDSEVGFTGDLAMKYIINDRWTWTNSVRYETLPSPRDVNYVINDLSISTGLSRSLLIGRIAGGVEYGFSEYEAVGPVTKPREDEENFSYFLSYQRPLFSDRAAFDTAIRYVTNEGRKDYSQWQISAGITLTF